MNGCWSIRRRTATLAAIAEVRGHRVLRCCRAWQIEARARRHGLGVLLILVLTTVCGVIHADDAGVAESDGGLASAATGKAQEEKETKTASFDDANYDKKQRFLDKVESSDPMELASDLAELDKQKARLQARKRQIDLSKHEIEAADSELHKVRQQVVEQRKKLKASCATPKEPKRNELGVEPAPKPTESQPSIDPGVLVRLVATYEAVQQKLERGLQEARNLVALDLATTVDPSVQAVASDWRDLDTWSQHRARESATCDDALERANDLFLSEPETTAVLVELEKEHDEAVGELSFVTFQMETIEVRLRSLGTASTNVISKLPWLVAALGLFSLAIMVMVQRFRTEIQSEWVQSGQVTQFMTVTILVTVVLVLGLAKVIEKETLGTLLGAIAGYVLSQGVDRVKSRRPNPPATPDAPRRS